MQLKNLRNLFLFLMILFACANGSSLFAQQPAFPGAEGAGMYTTGGRGTASTPTTVFEVTNLNDDNSPGSLRYAVQASSSTYPFRTIVFRVSGTIHLTSKLNIRANTTLAGQTAPGGGICIADHPVAISGDNVIIRYIRFRMGDKNQNKGMVNGSGGDDALGALGANNIIIDHCSVSWSSDEALTIYRGDNLTIQWTFIAEPLNYSYHFETGDSDFEKHGYGGIWGAKRGSFHHNLFAHCYSRNPRFAGVSTYTPNTIGVENADFRNNVIYNWGINTVYGGEGGNYNVVNNYYKYGPNTNAGVKYRIANPGYSASVPYGKWYVDGNYVDGSAANTTNNWAGVVMQNASDDPNLAKATTPFSLGYPQATQTALDAYEAVLQSAGAVLPKRDTLDQRIVNNVRARTGGIIDVQGGYPHGTPYNQTTGAWPSLASTAAPTDGDHDGMPDSWETANGLNPADASDRAGYNANGYTNLENYLASITASNPSIHVAGTLAAFSQTAGTPSATQTYSVSGADLEDNITITAPAGYQLSSDAGATWSATPLTLARTGNTLAATTISVRLNAASGGSFSGSILHSSTSAAINLPISGTASIAPPAGTNVVVAKDGSGNYATVQAAIDAAPSGSTTPYIIYIKNGFYKEKVNIPSGKPFLQLVGESAGGTVISWDDYSGKVVNGVTIGTSTSATLTMNAADCFLMNITVENTTSNTADGPQALALNVSGDRCAFKNCRFNGGQDTVLANGDGKRQYFSNCYIDGNTDFIFGSSTAVFDSCVIYPRDRYDGSSGGYITAANTPSGQSYGYVFRNCIITKNRGITTYTLGRPWQNDASTPDASKKHNKVVFLNTAMSTSISPAGWSVWDAGTNTSLITYAEYRSKHYNGNPVNVSGRVAWSKQLTDGEAAPYFVNSNLFGSWGPCAAFAAVCTPQVPELAVSNMRAQRQTASTLLSWNLSWPVAGVTYELYRSTNNTTFAKIHEVTSAMDTVVAFSYTDALPASGTTYYYFVKAVKSGFISNNSFVASVNSDTPLDGEFRSAGSGYYNNASTGGTINPTSIWERYVASSSTWVLQPLGTKPGSSTVVTIRAAHTVVLDGLNSVNSLVIETGATFNSAGTASTNTGLQTLRVGNGTQPVTAFVRNNGTLGSASGTND
ncbi:MAG TPA: pectinesterase family protein, partial [Flavisolibacter sp.]|nr:pectinesterase family protein [Flavisolibacter sp.]